MKGNVYRFSIVIPCYNEEKFIANALKSLKRQDFNKPFEIIVVDNNSDDKTYAVAKKYGVRLVREKRRGVTYARQAGTAIAKGDIIISTDADTVFPKSWLSDIDRAFVADPTMIAIGGDCRYYDGPWWKGIYTGTVFTTSYLWRKLFKHPLYIAAANFAFKREYFPGYNVTFDQGSDELGLLHELESIGKVGFTLKNPVYTSGRRLNKGLFYNLFITCFYYYVIGYILNSKFKRQVVKQYPAFRDNVSKSKLLPRWLIASEMLAILVTVYFLPNSMLHKVNDYRQDFVRFFETIF